MKPNEINATRVCVRDLKIVSSYLMSVEKEIYHSEDSLKKRKYQFSRFVSKIRIKLFLLNFLFVFLFIFFLLLRIYTMIFYFFLIFLINFYIFFTKCSKNQDLNFSKTETMIQNYYESSNSIYLETILKFKTWINKYKTHKMHRFLNQL